MPFFPFFSFSFLGAFPVTAFLGSGGGGTLLFFLGTGGAGGGFLPFINGGGGGGGASLTFPYGANEGGA